MMNNRRGDDHISVHGEVRRGKNIRDAHMITNNRKLGNSNNSAAKSTRIHHKQQRENSLSSHIRTTKPTKAGVNSKKHTQSLAPSFPKAISQIKLNEQDGNRMITK